jgi:hypothetical protein
VETHDVDAMVGRVFPDASVEVRCWLAQMVMGEVEEARRLEVTRCRFLRIVTEGVAEVGRLQFGASSLKDDLVVAEEALKRMRERCERLGLIPAMKG